MTKTKRRRREELTDDERELKRRRRISLTRTFRKWKAGNLHEGTGVKGKVRGLVDYPSSHKQAIAIALSKSGKINLDGRARRMAIAVAARRSASNAAAAQAGQACGNSYISSGYECRVGQGNSGQNSGGRVAVRQRHSSKGPVAQYGQSAATLPEGVEARQTGVNETSYEFSQGDSKIALVARHGSRSTEVEFKVDGRLHDTSTPGNPVDRANAATKLAGILASEVANSPDGHTFKSTAVGRDGRGLQRAMAATAMGFSRPLYGTPGMEQKGIVQGGRLVPDNAALAAGESTAKLENPDVYDRRWEFATNTLREATRSGKEVHFSASATEFGYKTSADSGSTWRPYEQPPELQALAKDRDYWKVQGDAKTRRRKDSLPPELHSRQDFVLTPTADVVITSDRMMWGVDLTFAAPPDPAIAAEIKALFTQPGFDTRPGMYATIGGEEMAPLMEWGKTRFHIELPEVYCPDRSGEAIATELEGVYGLSVIRKRRAESGEFRAVVVSSFMADEPRAEANGIRHDQPEFERGRSDALMLPLEALRSGRAEGVAQTAGDAIAAFAARHNVNVDSDTLGLVGELATQAQGSYQGLGLNPADAVSHYVRDVADSCRTHLGRHEVEQLLNRLGAPDVETVLAGVTGGRKVRGDGAAEVMGELKFRMDASSDPALDAVARYLTAEAKEDSAQLAQEAGEGLWKGMVIGIAIAGAQQKGQEAAQGLEPAKKPRADKEGQPCGASYISPDYTCRVKESAASPGQAMQFYSPNVEEGLNYATARKALGEDRQKWYKSYGDNLDRKVLGLEQKSYDVIGDWSDGAENTVMSVIEKAPDYETVRYSAAMKGLVGEQKAVLPFMADPDGPDSVYAMEVGGSVDEIRASLGESGIEFRTIQPTDQGAKVYVFDEGTQLEDQVAKFAEKHDVNAKRVRGKGEFLGSWESREEGEAAYREVISEYESKNPGLHRPGRDRRRGDSVELRKSRARLPRSTRVSRGDRLAKSGQKSEPGQACGNGYISGSYICRVGSTSPAQAAEIDYEALGMEARRSPGISTAQAAGTIAFGVKTKAINLGRDAKDLLGDSPTVAQAAMAKESAIQVATTLASIATGPIAGTMAVDAMEGLAEAFGITVEEGHLPGRKAIQEFTQKIQDALDPIHLVSEIESGRLQERLMTLTDKIAGKVEASAVAAATGITVGLLLAPVMGHMAIVPATIANYMAKTGTQALVKAIRSELYPALKGRGFCPG